MAAACTENVSSHFFVRFCVLTIGQVKTEETENGELKQKTEAEIGNGKAEIRKWSSMFVALRAPFAHVRSVWG